MRGDIARTSWLAAGVPDDGPPGSGPAITRVMVAHGARVLVVDPGPAPDKPPPAAAGGRAEYLRRDVLDAGVDDLVRDHEPDVLVNNVGHFVRPPRPFAENDPGSWPELADVNLGHAMRLTHAVLPGMTERGGGSIINLTTVEAHRAIPGHVVYSTYKAALAHFTRSLAVEVGRHGIRVNAIVPDLIETPQVPYDSLVPDEDRHRWPTWAPLGGPGTPEDVAGAGLFLASDLSRYVTGTTIHVDDGTYAAGGWFPRDDGTGWTNRPRRP